MGNAKGNSSDGRKLFMDFFLKYRENTVKICLKPERFPV
jgi:hypothetical protein